MFAGGARGRSGARQLAVTSLGNGRFLLRLEANRLLFVRLGLGQVWAQPWASSLRVLSTRLLSFLSCSLISLS